MRNPWPKTFSASEPTDVGKTNGEMLRLVNWEVAETAVFQRQYVIILGLVVLVLMVYALRIWYLQVVQGGKYRYQSENNRVRLEDIPSPRGIIFDRNGVALVENRPAYHLLVVREDVPNLDATVQELARLSGRDAGELYGVLEANKQIPKFLPIRLLGDVDRDTLARVEAQRVRLPGVIMQLEPKREYKCNGSAAHLIGYLSEVTEMELQSEVYEGYYPGENVGKSGVEKAFERYLHGKRGARQVEVDAVGRRMRLLNELLPISGRNLWLTIDIGLQRTAEGCLQDKVGAIVAIDPNNGAILALASQPTFDQERFVRGLSKTEWQQLSRDPNHPLLNRAFGAAYPPGSTYKPFVALGALQDGLITLQTGVFCPGYYRFADRNYRCWRDHGHGTLQLHQGLVQSCDVFFYQTGMRLGVDRLAHWANLFGLGEKSGIGLHGEHPGLVPTSWWKKQALGVPWQKGETLSISIGQGFDLVTPLQLTLAYAAIANGGRLWQPFVVQRIEGGGPDETSEIRGKLKRRVPIDARHFDAVRKALLGVVEEPRGTAHAIRLPDLTMAGKTGTAQVVSLGEGVDRKQAAKAAKKQEQDHAWFVGFAPADSPRIVVGALIEHGGHGSSAAAPLVQKVIAAFLSRTASGSGL